MEVVLWTLFVAAHPFAVTMSVLVRAVEAQRAHHRLAANFRDVLHLVAMAALGAPLLALGFTPPASFLVGFLAWLVLYGLAHLSIRLAFGASPLVAVPVVLFSDAIRDFVTHLVANIT